MSLDLTAEERAALQAEIGAAHANGSASRPFAADLEAARTELARGNGSAVTEAQSWLDGAPMDPAAATIEPLPAVPGFPYAHRGAGVVIVGPTGGGRSSLVQAGAYDAARAGLRVAYLGSEITEVEFNARAARLADYRDDAVDDELRADLARVRYLDLASTIRRASNEPAAWARLAAARFDVVIVDPLASVASTLDLDFDRANAEYVRVYDRLVQPLVTAGVLVVLPDNIGHAVDAQNRAKGASAKGDRADLTMSCTRQEHPLAMIVTAQKVRGIRAPFQRGAAWIFDHATQRIVEHANATPGAGSTCRPTVLMQRVSRALQDQPGLSKRAIRVAVKGKANDAKDQATELLISEGYVRREREGRADRHYLDHPFVSPDKNSVPERAASVPGTIGGDVPDVPLPVGSGTQHAHRNGTPQDAQRAGHRRAAESAAANAASDADAELSRLAAKFPDDPTSSRDDVAARKAAKASSAEAGTRDEVVGAGDAAPTTLTAKSSPTTTNPGDHDGGQAEADPDHDRDGRTDG